MRSAQYFLPSAHLWRLAAVYVQVKNQTYLSYAVELRKDSAKLTTNPVTVKRISLMPTSEDWLAFSHILRKKNLLLWTNLEMRVMTVAQAATKARGKIIFGMILPCIRRKMGHLECRSRSRGPCYTSIVSPSGPSQYTLILTYEISIDFTRVASS